MTIGDFRPEHWSEVPASGADEIATGDATFETKLPNWERSTLASRPDRVIARRDGAVIG